VLWAHLRSLNRSERWPPTLELAHVYAEHAPIMALFQQCQRGLRYAQKSLDIRRQLGDTWGQGQSLHCQSVALSAAGQCKEAVEKGREAIRLLQRAGDQWEIHLAQYHVATALYRHGDLLAADE
jgi:two-component system sensor kinase